MYTLKAHKIDNYYNYSVYLIDGRNNIIGTKSKKLPRKKKKLYKKLGLRYKPCITGIPINLFQL